MELPAELYRPIIGHVKHWPTLISLLLTSRHIGGEAERSLYYKFEHIHNVQTQVLFLQRVVDCPLKNTYSGSLLSKAFRAMVNLKVLQFRTNGGMPMGRPLDGCSFQLEQCLWRCHSDEEHMISFLPTQRKLRNLDLGGWDDTRFSAPICEQPDFRELTGYYGVVRAFLPGRNITHVGWIPDLDDPMDVSEGLDIVGLAPSLRKLRFLKFGGYFARPHLRNISDHLESLAFLELMGYKKDEDLSVIALPSLKLLRLSMPWIPNSTPISDPEALTAVLFTRSKSLETIEIEFKSTYADEGRVQHYSRWERNIGMVTNNFSPNFETWPSIR
ncbi:hypothetical protein BT96DRAFT_992940 [Gymnopus androsaceus JB14]|uniref:F-box domain-containing protein n=1 Tax=Gymnopus androsaceus JB14 TaxID=1447944 RepID=A0A6A4HQQ6_9AGAR|nr:hypothetical protein BT96DRAFT_992940 [Gymnopus androsaceus JB14]